jgi:hypothetical protein
MYWINRSGLQNQETINQKTIAASSRRQRGKKSKVQRTIYFGLDGGLQFMDGLDRGR